MLEMVLTGMACAFIWWLVTDGGSRNAERDERIEELERRIKEMNDDD